MSIFYNKKEAEIELTNTRNYWIDRFFTLSLCISKTPLDVNVALKYKNLIIADIEKYLLIEENMIGGKNIKKKIAFYSSLNSSLNGAYVTMGYLLCWSKAIASVMYYAYELFGDFPNEKETKEKLSNMLFSQFSKEDGLLSQVKDSFFDYKEYVVQYLHV